MKIIQGLKNFIKKTTKNFSFLVRTILKTGASLLGLRYKDKRWEYKYAAAAGWSFIITMPIGLILIPKFSLPISLITIISILILCNLDHTLELMSKKVTREESKCTSGYI